MLVCRGRERPAHSCIGYTMEGEFRLCPLYKDRRGNPSQRSGLRLTVLIVLKAGQFQPSVGGAANLHFSKLFRPCQ